MSELTRHDTMSLMRKLRQQGTKIALVEGNLKIELPKALKTQTLMQELRLHKSNIIEILQAVNETRARTSTIPVVPRTGKLPLSYAQERFWFLELLNQGISPFHIPMGLELTGVLDFSAIQKSFEQLIKRHESLRVSFLEEGGEPYVAVAASVEFEIERLDLQGLDEASVETNLRAFMQRPFNLSTAPLMRVGLFKKSEEEHLLMIVLHHLIADGWSLGVLTDEITKLYNGFVANTAVSLPHLPIQFIDYVHWQRSEDQTKRLENDVEYWLKTLEGMPPVLELPYDNLRPSQITYEGDSLDFKLDADLYKKLMALSQQEGVTLFITLLSALQVLLYWHSQQDDFAIGTAVANRPRVEIEGLIGLFTNMLALRGQFKPDMTIRDLMKQARQVTLDAMAHQELPFEKLVEELNPERLLGVNPIYQVILILQNADFEDPEFSGLKVDYDETSRGAALLDLVFELWEDEGTLMGQVEYNTALFKPESIQVMLDHYKVVLQAFVADAETAIADVDVLLPEERRKLLVEWNDTAVYYDDRPTPDLFCTQAERTPEKTAVRCGQDSLTFAQLDQKSNQVAHYLIDQGVTSDNLVGLAMNRSVNMLVALLGIWKAGGAYVPLDPDYPQARLAHMVNDSGMPLLVTETSLHARFAEYDVKTLIWEDAQPAIVAGSTAPPEITLDNQNRAYVIYTSGSTGLPKGVQVPHKALSNFLWSMQDEPGLVADDVLVGVTTLSFDIHGLELWLPLITGAELVIVTPETSTDGVKLANLLNEVQADVLQATPATWKLLLDTGWQGRAGIKMLCGGEPLPRKLANQLLEKGGELWNMYGPTETTIWSSVEQVESGGEQITIGRPIANTQMYILNKQMKPVPVGTTGELYIGGDGVTIGYLNRDELTAEKFVPNPFGPNRIYNTGDMARYAHDGNLICLGRADGQVKVRGFRIELGEIEAVLARHPEINDVVVIVREDKEDDKRIVAYYTSDGQPDVRVLRDFVGLSVPYYMVPSSFMQMDEFPLTPNGKINRKALPKPELNLDMDEDKAMPETEAEIGVAQIWEEVLQIQNIGANDGFFDLGGHSLLAIRTLNRVRDHFGVEIALMDFFNAPTVADVAQQVEIGLWSLGGDDEFAFADVEESEEFIL